MAHSVALDRADAGPCRRGGVHLSAILALRSFAMMIVSLDQHIVVVVLPDKG
jgi:hypothetical protein